VRAPVAALALAACAPAAPDAPTWVEDVRPILAANCIRCHGHPAIGGAPAGFRLDVWGDVTSDGRLVRGAASMAAFVAARAAARGDMPPRGAFLSDRQEEILEAWQETVELGARPGNREPEATVLDVASDETGLTLEVTVTDADGDLVAGELRANDETVGPLRGGRQRVVWDTGGVVPGPHRLVALLDDGSARRAVELGERIVEDRGNAAPRVRFSAPPPDTLVHGRPVTVTFEVSDPDAVDEVTVELDAVRGETTIPIARLAGAARGANHVSWDASALPPSPSWRIRATVSDGKATRVTTSWPLIVSHSTTTETYASLKPLLDGLCARCHDARVPGGPDFIHHDQLRFLAGRAWRKVGQLRECPPKSVSVILPDAPLLSEEDRRRLAEWFLAGAP
jgi:cytochrome c5